MWHERVDVPSTVSVLFSTLKFIDLSSETLFQTNVPVLIQKLRSTLSKSTFCYYVHVVLIILVDHIKLMGKNDLKPVSVSFICTKYCH